MGQALTPIEKERNSLRKQVFSHKKTFSKNFESVPFNLLILGEVASGKSATINTLNTALSEDDIVHLPSLALSLPTDNVTSCYRKYRLTPPAKRDMYAYDSWGIYFGQTYVDDSLHKILAGRMPEGVKLVDPPQDRDPIEGDGVAVERYPTANIDEVIRQKKVIHIAVFCVKTSKVYVREKQNHADYEAASAIGKLMKDIHDETGIVSAVLLTACDALSDKVLKCESVDELRALPEVRTARENVGHALGIAPILVFPMLANVERMQRNPLIDANALCVLKELMDLAEHPFEQKLDKKNHPDLYK